MAVLHQRILGTSALCPCTSALALTLFLPFVKTNSQALIHALFAFLPRLTLPTYFRTGTGVRRRLKIRMLQRLLRR